MIADLIEAHLDQLLAQLRGSATDVRRILSEAEEHLRDATAELVAVGASEEEAQRLAIERFGDPRTVARRFSARLAPVPPAAVAGELVRAAVLLGAVGLVAIGASGLVAELLGRLFGAGFVAGHLPGWPIPRSAAPSTWSTSPTPAAAPRRPRSTTGRGGGVPGRRRRRARAAHPGRFLLWRRRPDRQDPRYLGVLPDGFSATVAASLYGVAAGVLALLSLDAFLVAGGDGTGQWLSAAIVASAMAVVYGVSLYRTVLNRARLGAATFPLDQAARPSS